MTAKNVPKKTPKNDTTLLVLIVDRSGSMESIRKDMEGGIKTLIADQAEEPGTCLVTLAQFDTEYELLYEGVPSAELGAYELVPRGATALLDAMGHTITSVRSKIKALPSGKRPGHVIVAVVTDGLENSSVEWTRDAVMAAVQDRIEAGWHFTFIGANQDAIQAGADVGVSPASSLNYAATPAGSRGAMDSLSASVRRVRRGEAGSIGYTEDERRRSTGS